MGNSVFFRHVPQGEVCKSDSHLSSAQLAAAACKGWHNDDVRWCMQLAWQRQKLTLINAITLAGSEHALTAVTLEMAKASELSTAQLLAQPRSFLKLNFVFFLALESTYFRLLKWIVLEFVMEAQLHSLVLIEDFQVYSANYDIYIITMTYHRRNKQSVQSCFKDIYSKLLIAILHLKLQDISAHSVDCALSFDCLLPDRVL